jgi:hypothetical protein
VRQTFQTEKETRSWEHKVLRRMKVVKSNQWLNKTDNKMIDPKCCSCPGKKNGMYGKTHSTETRQKISACESGERNHYYGKHLSEEHRSKISNSNKGKIFSPEHCQKISESKKGNDYNNERIANGTHNLLGSESNKKRLANGTHPTQIKKICPHCGKDVVITIYGRYHGDKCKSKIT